MNEIIKQNKFFTAYRVADSVTRIQGLAMESCYLIEGTERALLIDGLIGIGSLRAFVRELTELPVTIFLTHGHMDHTGIAWESDCVYLHPDDVSLLYSEMSSKKSRLDFVNIYVNLGVPCRTKLMENDVLEPHTVKVLPIKDADFIDLGEIKIEVIAVQGHTGGTVVFLDRKNRFVYAGDACNSNTLLNLNGSTSIAEYKSSLEHLLTFESEFDFLWNGHDRSAVPKKIINDGIVLCKKILARTDDAIETEDAFSGKSYVATERGEGDIMIDGSLCNIVYKLETIYQSKRSVL